MNDFNLFIANASGLLDKHVSKIQSAFKDATSSVSEILQLKKVDIICVADPSMVIPEIGIGGYTPNRYLTYLYIDPTSDIDQQEIFNTLCHELHHAKRYEAEGFGITLFDSMIFEGLATAFEKEMAGVNPSFVPDQLLSRNNTPSIIRDVQKDLYEKSFNHFKWFIYDEGGTLPRWAGYEIGYYIIRNYMSKTNKKASALVLEASSAFSDYLRDTPGEAILAKKD